MLYLEIKDWWDDDDKLLHLTKIVRLAEAIVKSNLTWEEKCNYIFSRDIADAVHKLGFKIEPKEVEEGPFKEERLVRNYVLELRLMHDKVEREFCGRELWALCLCIGRR